LAATLSGQRKLIYYCREFLKNFTADWKREQENVGGKTFPAYEGWWLPKKEI
jgi:hypothetical protein